MDDVIHELVYGPAVVCPCIHFHSRVACNLFFAFHNFLFMQNGNSFECRTAINPVRIQMLHNFQSIDLLSSLLSLLVTQTFIKRNESQKILRGKDISVLMYVLLEHIHDIWGPVYIFLLNFLSILICYLWIRTLNDGLGYE